MSLGVGKAGGEIPPARHGLVVPGEKGPVAGGPPHIPGHKHHGALPGQVLGVEGLPERYDHGQESVFALGIADLGKPKVEKRPDIEKQAFRPGDAERVTEPAVALAVRTVCGN